MDFELSDVQKELQRTALKFAEKELSPYASDWDCESYFPVDKMRLAGKYGFGGMYIDEKYGGANLSHLDVSIIFEALSKGCVSTTAFLSFHNTTCWIIEQFGTEEQKSKWLPNLTSLDKIISFCSTEPGAGSDPHAIQTNVENDGDFYILNGVKQFITGSGISDFYLVLFNNGGPPPFGLSIIVVEKEREGLSFGKLEKKMGWKSMPTGQVIFNNCRVPKINQIGKDGEGLSIAARALNAARLNMAALSIGPAENAIKIALKHAKERVQFGSNIFSFQTTQQRFAEMITKYESARLLMYKAACLLDNNDTRSTMFCPMAKRLATENCFDVVNMAMKVLGAYGYTSDYPIERWLRDLRATQIGEGTNDIMGLLVARELQKQMNCLLFR